MYSRVRALLRSIEGRSFVLGVLVAWLPFTLAAPVLAWDFNLRSVTSLSNLGRRVVEVVETLGGIKSGLDADVGNLKDDAKLLVGDAGHLLEIKNRLTVLSEQTQSQIAQINKLVGTVEGHIKKTQEDIASTAKNVARIDDVRKTLLQN